MEKKQRFQAQFPDRFFLETDPEVLGSYLKRQSWIAQEESITLLEKPGEGKMKQARPWVEKYPQIEAPVERVGVEAAFFAKVNKIEKLGIYSPTLKGFDEANGILAMEDLGQGADYLYLYQRGNALAAADLEHLLDYLSVLHNHHFGNINFPDNLAMRQLNHEHIFNFPFVEENGFNLDNVQQGLQAAAKPYKTDDELKNKVSELGKLYLSPGACLLHGDYYPGSWLKVSAGLKVIDPEFGFIGLPEFELGVLIAHMMMAEQGEEIFYQIMDQYQFPKGFDSALLAGFAGTEILRRLIGIAQLPLSLNLEQKKALMRKAAQWILSSKME